MDVKKILAFVVNPIAGMGGAVGLKGTDGLYREAIERGAKPVAPRRAYRYLNTLKKLGVDVEFIAPSGEMGGIYLSKTGFRHRVVYHPRHPTTPDDTVEFIEIASDADAIVFLGGDGTARDVCRAKPDKPVIPIPSGVKMFSPCFAISPEAGAILTRDYLIGGADTQPCEVIDVDEELYRKGILELRRYCSLKAVKHPSYVQAGKQPTTKSEEELYNIAQYIIDMMDPNTFYVTGPGNTVKTIHKALGLRYTLLGFDVIKNKKLVDTDIDAARLMRYVLRGKTKIVISPVGGSGFLLGRGNQVITPNILSKLSVTHDLIVVSTRDKLLGRDCLYIDLEDPRLISKFPDTLRVVVGYKEYYVARICKDIDGLV